MRTEVYKDAFTEDFAIVNNFEIFGVSMEQHEAEYSAINSYDVNSMFVFFLNSHESFLAHIFVKDCRVVEQCCSCI